MNNNNTEFELALERISQGMNWSKEKSKEWMHTVNPHLGNCKPVDFFIAERGYKVLQFIEGALENNSLEKESE